MAVIVTGAHGDGDSASLLNVGNTMRGLQLNECGCGCNSACLVHHSAVREREAFSILMISWGQKGCDIK